MGMYFHFSWKIPKSRMGELYDRCVCATSFFFFFSVNQVLLLTGSFLSCKQSVPVFPY